MKSMTMKLGEGSDIRVALNTNQTASTTEALGLAMEVIRGSVWVTLEGVREDYVLNPGERLPVQGRGRLVIQGLAQSEIKFVRHASSDGEPALRTTVAPRPARQHAFHPGECLRNFVGGLSTGRLNIDNPI
ncbi:MAG: DUF2917 domain-containing protein [Betaproteobacteria bacterium]